MKPRILPDKIQTWDGASQLAAELSRRGFLIPDRFIELTAPLLGKAEEAWREELRRYSTEYVRCSGRIDQKRGVGSELAFVRRELVMNADLRDRFPLLEKRWKAAEVVSDVLLQQGWSDQKAHLRRIAQQVAQAEGFCETAKGYRMELHDGMLLEVDVDIGRPGSTVQQIVMNNRLHTKDGCWEMWLPWDELLPGVGFYMNGEDSATLIWGIKAFVATAKAFALTLS